MAAPPAWALVLGALATGAALWRWGLQGLSDAARDAASRAGLGLALAPEQQAMVALILDRFARAGVGRYGPGAVANAWHESRLRPDAISGYPGEDSVGLFQLNSAARALGAGMTQAERSDPEINIARVVDEVKRLNAAGRGLRAGATNAEAASWFAAEVERCVGCQKGGNEYNERAATVDRFWPGASQLPAGEV